MAKRIVVQTWLTPGQAALRARVGAQTIGRWGKTRPLEREWDGRKWWYLASSLDALLFGEREDNGDER